MLLAFHRVYTQCLIMARQVVVDTMILQTVQAPCPLPNNHIQACNQPKHTHRRSAFRVQIVFAESIRFELGQSR